MLFIIQNIMATIYVRCSVHTGSTSQQKSNVFTGPARDEKGVEGFEEAFKALGRSCFVLFVENYAEIIDRFIFNVGRELAVACQPFGERHRDLTFLPFDRLTHNNSG